MSSGAYFLIVIDSEGNSIVGSVIVGVLDELGLFLVVVNGG